MLQHRTCALRMLAGSAALCIATTATPAHAQQPSWIIPDLLAPAKAERELGYRARPYKSGIEDAILWFRRAGYIR